MQDFRLNLSHKISDTARVDAEYTLSGYGMLRGLYTGLYNYDICITCVVMYDVDICAICGIVSVVKECKIMFDKTAPIIVDAMRVAGIIE